MCGRRYLCPGLTASVMSSRPADTQTSRHPLVSWIRSQCWMAWLYRGYSSVASQLDQMDRWDFTTTSKRRTGRVTAKGVTQLLLNEECHFDIRKLGIIRGMAQQLKKYCKRELASPQFSVLAPSVCQQSSPYGTPACLLAWCVSSHLENLKLQILLKSTGKQNHKISKTVGSQQPLCLPIMEKQKVL